MFTILDYSSALEYTITRRYTNIVYYYYYLFVMSGCCLLCCDVVWWVTVGVWVVVIFVLSVMRVVGGVPLWVECVWVSSCRCCVFVSVVHPVAILSAVFCVICSLMMFVSDAKW